MKTDNHAGIDSYEYTRQTRKWLNHRYQLYDLRGAYNLTSKTGCIQGIYHAHQPIYGLWNPCCEPGRLTRYAITWHLLQTLQKLTFTSLLDAGAAEGFTQDLIRNMLSVKTVGMDLSERGCLRAKEIYHLNSAAADIHHLPFRTEGIDVIICSETLEHVCEPDIAIEEMLRVARVAVLISVPLESEDIVEHNRLTNIPHAHIYRFTSETFREKKWDGWEIQCRPILSTLFLDLCNTLESFRTLAVNCADQREPICAMIREAILLDASVSEETDSAHGCIFTFIKKRSPQAANPRNLFGPQDLLENHQPEYCMQTWNLPAWEKAVTESDSLLGHVDRLAKTANGIHITGWGFVRELHAEFQRLSMAFFTEDHYFLFPARVYDRPDVEQHFSNPNYLHSGFEVWIPLKDLPSGEYQLELVCNHMGLIVRRRMGIRSKVESTEYHECSWSG